MVDHQPDIELRDLRKTFRDVVAVDGVSLLIERGEFFSLLGPSGCGKTTTLRMIAGFEYPTAGEILIQGETMGEKAPFERNVNTVFQHYALFPHMNVAENVGFGLRMKGIAKRDIASRVEEALALVRLAGLGERRPRQLSGGQQQRVALARALVNRPAVLLLDEPLGALDLKLRKEMQFELKRLQRESGTTFIYVTHDQEEALTMSDRIAVMDGGRVLQVGTPVEIYERPSSRFVASFIGESNFLDGVVRLIEVNRVVVEAEGFMVEVPLPDSGPIPTVGQQVTVAIRPEKVQILPLPVAGANGAAALSGCVERAIYAGTDIHVVVRLSPNATVRARLTNDDGSSAMLAAIMPGAEVALRWRTGSGHLLAS